MSETPNVSYQSEIFSTVYWKLKVPSHDIIKQKYLGSFIDGYENDIYKIPDGWVTTNTHTSFVENKLEEKDIIDEYNAIFDTIFENEWRGNFECWYQVYKNGEYQEYHDHLPSALSAIHFLRFNEEHKVPIFEDPASGLKSITYASTLNKKLSRPSLTFTPEVEEGDIIIFPSYLKHAVPGGIYDSHRVTISFNLFITQ